MNPQSADPKSPWRILYAVGPGDVVGQYRELAAGKPPPFQIGMSFSKQFVDWCDEAGVETHLVSSHERRDFLQVGPHRVENLPNSALYFGGGIKHHIGTLLYGLRIVAMARRERPTILIVDSGTTHWIVLSLLSLFRIPVIAVLHNCLWPRGFPPARPLDRVLRWLDGIFFRRFAAATVCVSPECERQVRKVAGTTKGPVYQCRVQYRHGFLERAGPVPPHESRPFRTLFLGRIEESKGVFLILSIAERLEKEMPGQFAWKITGSGSATEELLRQARERKLDGVVEVPGRIADEQGALEVFRWAHAMVVPTTSHFREGLTMSAVEAILAGRPVVVSGAVPVGDVLGRAAIEVETDVPDGFVAAFRRLATDAAYYDECRRATLEVQGQFYDASQGLGAVLGRAIAELNAAGTPASR